METGLPSGPRHDPARGGLAFLFPGQGSQYAGMGRELAAAFPEAARAYEEASGALGFDVARLCFEGPEERLTLTEHAQPAILATSLASASVVRSLGLTPDIVAGHSLGEYSALTVAGGLSASGCLRLVRLRGEMMAGAMPPGEGSMAAILGLDHSAVEEICREAGGDVVVANINSPGQVVVSGRAADVERAAELARGRGARRVLPLAVSGAFHSPLMGPVAARFAGRLEEAGLGDLTVPLVSNADAVAHTAASEVLEQLGRQMSAPVRWEESMRLLVARGVTAAVEIGPRKVLAGLMKRIAPEVMVLGADTPSDMAALAEFWERKGGSHG